MSSRRYGYSRKSENHKTFEGLKKTHNSHFRVTPKKSLVNVCLMKILKSTVTKKSECVFL